MKYIFLICPIASLLVCQLIKILIAILNKKNIDLKLITSSGGIPSTHSCFVSSLSTIIGLVEGFDSSVFSMSLVFALITCYDASHVRFESGVHAHILNQKYKLNLRENIGHKLHEVIAGISLGVFITLVIYFV